MSKWEMVRLATLFTSLITGEWGEECAEDNVGIPVLRTTNFTSSGEISYDKIAFRNIASNKVDKKKLQFGDIILEKSGGTENTPVGRVVFCDERIEKSIYLCNNFTQAMRPDFSIVVPRYIFYAMWNLHQCGMTDLLQNKTTGIRNLQVKAYLESKIPLPPLAEQQKIAAELDKISGLIAKRKRQIEKLDLLVKARFVEMFGDPGTNPMGWSKVPLRDCLYKIENGKSFVCKSDCRKGNNPAVLKLSAVTYGTYDEYENKAMIGETDFCEYAEVKSGDLLFTRKNTPELVGMAAYVYKTAPKLMMPDLIFRLCTTKICNKIYLWKLINHELFRNAITGLANGSAKSMSNISKERLNGLIIPLPPLPRQIQFVDFVQKTEQTKATMKKGLAGLETLYKARMQEYFE